MNPYNAMAKFYDELTSDVDYEKWADYLCLLFKRHGCSPKTVLDLACGTGSLTRLLALRGYDMTAADVSAEMLSAAQMKCADLSDPPLFLQQRMEELDLYDTVDACVCCLDSINYLTHRQALLRALQRVRLFLSPGGLFIFDINTKEKLEGLDGRAFVRETDSVYCAWQASYARSAKTVRYDIDLFEKTHKGYVRYEETHRERAYSLREIQKLLREAGFGQPDIYGEFTESAPAPGEQRIFFAVRKEPV